MSQGRYNVTEPITLKHNTLQASKHTRTLVKPAEQKPLTDQFLAHTVPTAMKDSMNNIFIMM